MKNPIFNKAVKTDQRICFGIMYFDNEADAIAADKEVRRLGITYNGGYFHGMLCGRDKSFDEYKNQYKAVWSEEYQKEVFKMQPKEEWGDTEFFAVTY